MTTINPAPSDILDGPAATVVDGGDLTLDTHYVWPLDDQPPATTAGPTLVDTPAVVEDRRPILPPALHRGNIGPATRRAAGRTGHRAAYHGLRAPVYAAKAAWWSVVGVGRVGVNAVRWWWVVEQHRLRQQAATDNDAQTWLKLHNDARATRAWRGSVLAGAVLALLGGGAALTLLAPRWVLYVVVAALVPVLARYGRPVGKPILTPAVVVPRFRIINADIVLRAYYTAKLADAEKAPITFASTMARDGEGSRVLVDMPYGVAFGQVVKARAAIASGLDVTEAQVYLTRDRTSTRRHQLWVADRDPLAIPAGRTPLLGLRQTDIWTPAPFGLDERGQLVTADLMWTSWLVGAIPRQGKTFSARLLALYAALDPYVRLHVYDGKGSPDWRKFALVAHRVGFGLALSRDGDPFELLLDDLRALKAEVQDRYNRLSMLPTELAPEGKLTRELARDRRARMPVILCVFDEVQEYLDGGGNSDVASEIAGLLIYLVKVGPAAGVIVLSSTQRPGGIPGKVGQQFVQFRDQHQVRFGLRTGSWNVSDLVLGAGAYSEGFDTSTLLPEYKGVGILRGASDRTPTVRTFLADGNDAEAILIAARRLREKAGTLSGVAAGEQVAREPRDVLADMAGVYYAGEAFVSWAQLADRLADQEPDAYAGTTKEAISAQARALGIPSASGRHPDVPDQVLRGARRADVETALRAREIDGDGDRKGIGA